jgi:prephenate dehydratase
MKKNMKISIQGEAGSFHDMAARQYFSGQNIELVPCATFDLTLNTVKEGIADFAMMAIENARAGSILYNYTLIRESGLRILGEHNLRVKQNLMALPGQQLSDITEIRSHPIALSQCMLFLNDHPEITLIESTDTAGSAKDISEQSLKGVATIASTIAAKLYGLEILAEGIETYTMNYTRFLVIGSETNATPGGNKASVCFSLVHQPGSLAKVLLKLAGMEINLSKIQSVPKINGGWGYMFYLDLELGNNSGIEAIKNELTGYTTDLEILGVYNKSEKLNES